MFDIGWTELLLIGIVALIVVGPKDLPGMFRTLGRFTGKARAMARDFQRAMNDAADEAGVKDLNTMAGDLRKATSPTKLGLDRLNEAADRFEKWEPGKGKKPADGGDETPAMGPETTKLSEERAEAARKIRERAAETAKKRIAAETAAASEGTGDATETKPAKPAAKPRAKKPAAAAKPRTAASKAKKPATAGKAKKPTAAAKPKPPAGAKARKPAKPAGDSSE